MAELCQGLEAQGRSHNLKGGDKGVAGLERAFMRTKDYLIMKYSSLEV
jgi:hypothetical protein